MMALVFLSGWTLVAAGWWTTACLTVRTARRNRKRGDSAAPAVVLPSVTVFKPLPPLPSAGVVPPAWRGALESFLTQLGPGDELIFGVPEPDSPAWSAAMEHWHSVAACRVVTVSTPRPETWRNPKIAWLHRLAPLARGEQWLWSDADVTIPPGGLAALREEFQIALSAGARLLTSPYFVPTTDAAPGMLDLLYVNLELTPGVFLLGRGDVDFALGALCLFRASDFRERVEWDRLGHALADDYQLGQALQPVRIAHAEQVGILAEETTWPAAWGHYFRWQKNVRWCRPAGFAGQVALMPLLGWTVACACQPAWPVVWMGLVATLLLELLAATLICREAGCRWPRGGVLAVPLWSFCRIAAWVGAWLPVRAKWRGQEWKAPAAKG